MATKQAEVEIEQQQAEKPQETDGESASAAQEDKKDDQAANTSSTSEYNWMDHVNIIPAREFAKKQSVISDETEQIHCSPLVKDGNLVEYLYEDAKTLHEIFLRGLRVSNNGNCLGFRPGPGEPYQWLKYQEVLDRAQIVGSGLIAKGAETKSTQLIGIFCQNRVEWTLVEQACNGFSMAIVPLYGTLGPQAIRYIMSQCELQFIITDNNEKALKLLSDPEITGIKLIVIMEDINDNTKTKADERGVELMTFAELEKLGSESKKDFVPPSRDDLHTICYTSGTTGNPKGVMLTHKNFVSNAACVICIGYKNVVDLSPEDVYLSFLPLAHGLEKALQTTMYMIGGSIGFYRGDIKLLLDDAATLKPTVFPMVPRLVNKMYDKITAGINQSWFKKMLFDRAMSRKMKDLKKGIVSNNTIWDTIVFRRIQNLFGGRLRICVTGAAPISVKVLSFMRCVLGLPLMEGYGQTEATSIVSFTIMHDFAGGNVGTIVPSLRAKVVDVPEKDYFAKDNKGELCVKGPSVCAGYYKDPEKTKEAIDEDGWLHTGDIAEWLPDGSIKIIDRKKNIFKLAQGEYIAPEKIEQIYVQSVPVAQVYVHGESLKASLVAIVVPDPEGIVAWCKSRGVEGTYEEICGNAEAAKLILGEMNEVGKKNGLHSFELAKKIYLSAEQFTVEEELLTPTLKSRRPQLYKKYEDQINQLYEGLD